MRKTLTAVAVLGVLFAALGSYVYSLVPPVPQYVELSTPWTEQVDPENPLPEYPRPQLRRSDWQSLNGRWDFALTERDAPPPEDFDERIVVPFAVESQLSGVQKPVSPDERIWYRRTFETSPLEANERLLLHFGAVDWETEVYLNGEPVGGHQGGFDPFSLDVTDAAGGNRTHELVVSVWDPTNDGPQPIGKQTLEPWLISYTAVTGIWQTVWLERVPALYLVDLEIHADLDTSTVAIKVDAMGKTHGETLRFVVRAGDEEVASAIERLGNETKKVLRIPNMHPWSPDDPFLYDVEIEILRNGGVVDRVESYFGARKIETKKDAKGVWRLFLNGEPVFHLGLLDQGWWPDGLYTAPTDEALAFDIEATKRMGFNTIRKHVKVEPARWYWHADRLGILVWQDMPTGDNAGIMRAMLWNAVRGIDFAEGDYDLERSDRSAEIFRSELEAMLDALSFSTSVVVWVPFNEAWGQFETDAILDYVARRDPTRVVDGPSGFKDTGSGQLRDYHPYRGESDLPPLERDRPLVYGEYGGLGLEVEGHQGVEEGWGYSRYEDSAAFEEGYAGLAETIEALADRGLAAAIYTQTTDVESEINGLLTYDRRRFKVSPERLMELHRPILRRVP